ncbi:MAG: hypothetical protein ACFFA6_17205 [Promethearchaeota archaeon]
MNLKRRLEALAAQVQARQDRRDAAAASGDHQAARPLGPSPKLEALNRQYMDMLMAMYRHRACQMEAEQMAKAEGDPDERAWWEVQARRDKAEAERLERELRSAGWPVPC